MTRTGWVALGCALVVLLATATMHAQQRLAAGAVQANRAPHQAPQQPLPFSHKTHVGRGVRCQQCHTNPDPGVRMTFPATSICMNCHVSAAKERPAIVTLAEMAKSGGPIPWVRVYEVLPGVTWTHRKHVQAGMPCAQCHGNVGEADVMAEVTAVTGMASCVSCHQANKASTACATCHQWPAGG